MGETDADEAVRRPKRDGDARARRKAPWTETGRAPVGPSEEFLASFQPEPREAPPRDPADPRPWTPAETLQLRMMRAERAPLDAIALRLRRTRKDVARRIVQLGL